MFRIFVTMACTIVAMMSIHLGYLWQSTGEGLNPALAYPLATLLLVAPYILLMLARGDR
jgi:hypothetical protein